MNEQASSIQEPEVYNENVEDFHTSSGQDIVDLLLKAENAHQEGQHLLACDFAQKALDLSKETANNLLEFQCLDLLGETYFTLGALSDAYLCHKRALFICQELADRVGEAHSLWHLGRITRLLGRSQEALYHLETSLQIFTTLDNALGQADAFNELGNLLWDYRKRRDYYEQALDLVIIYGDTYRQARAHNNLAITYWELGLYSQALSYVKTAVNLGHETDDHQSLIHTLETLGRIYLSLKEYNLAEQAFIEGQNLTQQIQNTGSGSIYWLGLGRVSLEINLPDKAMQYISRAVEIQKEKDLHGYLHTSLAWLSAAHLAMNQYTEAETTSREAVEQLIASGVGEYPPQEVWWLRYQVLKSTTKDSEQGFNEKAFHALQRAYTAMMDNIADLSDEGLRRNYLNKVPINRKILNEWRQIATFRGDIDILKQIELAIKPTLDESELLRNKLQRMLVITRRMNETHDVTSLLTLIMNHMIELTGAGRGLLHLYDESMDIIEQTSYGFDLEIPGSDQSQLHEKLIDYVLESKKTLYIEDTSDTFSQENWRNQLGQNIPNALSVLCVPLLSGSNLLGVFYIDTFNVNGSFSKADLDFLNVYANQAVTAINNASLYEQVLSTNQELELLTHTLEERVQQRTLELEIANSGLSYRAMLLETIRQVAQQITSILDLDELLTQVVDLIREQFGYYFVGVWLLTPDETAAVLRAGTGTVGRALMEKALSIPLTTPSLISSVCKSGKSRIVEHVREVPDFLEVQELPNIVSEIVLPMYMGGELLGVLDISSDKATLFKEVDQILLQTLANQIAIAIRNARLYQAEITRRRLAENLEYAGRILTSSLDLLDVPGRVLDLLNTLVPYERGMILLENENTLRPYAIRGFPPHIKISDIQVPISNDDIYDQLYERREPLIVGDTTQNPGWTQLTWLPIHRSWMGVAIIVEDRMAGMISLTRRMANAFSSEDATWVQAFTPQAAIAIQNASLYSEIVSLNRNLEKRVELRTAELNQAYLQLQMMDETKSNFIKLAAHELRTPLTVIKGYGQMLKTFVQEQNTFILDGIETGTDRLTEVVNSMLDMAKIDTQTLDMAKQPTRLREVVQKVKREFQKAMDERNIVFENKGFAKLPVIQADPEMLTKVIHNLVVNAIKYTPDNGKVSVYGETVTDNGQRYVQIIIQDTGIGIAKEDQERIFDKFHLTGSLETHTSGRTQFKAGGPGLGLSIAKGIVLAHNGSIWVESEGYDEFKCPGSRFYIRLPIS